MAETDRGSVLDEPAEISCVNVFEKLSFEFAYGWVLAAL
jgi:hypothetical protein